MDEYQQNILVLLKEIRDLLEPISEESRTQFLQEKLKQFKAAITRKNRVIVPLLFDPRGLTQTQIAEEAEASQPTVSRLISELMEAKLIDTSTKNGRTIYIDKYNLMRLAS
jgi:DNA-directed RNA polymerase specialized sigma subunit